MESIEEIVAAADGIMVARGDLGVELDPETVPIAQLRLLELGRAHGKPTIVATQMLESMVTEAAADPRGGLRRRDRGVQRRRRGDALGGDRLRARTRCASCR